LNANYRWATALGFLILAFSTLPSAQEKPASRRERRSDDPRRRMEWFYRQRAFPLGRIPAGARLKALEQMEEMRRAESGRLSAAAPAPLEAGAAAPARPAGGAAIAASSTMWTPIGPQPVNSAFFAAVSGRVSALAVNPANPFQPNVYLGAAQGGVWKTTDGGTTWQPLTDFQKSLAVGSIAVDPTTCTSTGCSTIYVGTGEENFAIDSYYGAGVLKSTDGGTTWTQLGASVFVGPFSSGFAPGGGARIGALAVNPQNPSILLAGVQIFVRVNGGSSSGVYRSSDAGVTWSQVVSGAAGNEVLFDPSNPNTAYASLGTVRCLPPSGSSSCTGPGSSNNGIYKSTDAGMTWTRVLSPSSSFLPNSPNAAVGRIALAISPSTTSTLYAGISNSSSSSSFGTLLGFFKTTDGGTTWTQLTNTPDYCQPQCWYDNVVRVHPNDASVIYAGGSAANFSTGGYLVRSTDGGNSWTGMAANGARIHVDVHALAFGFTGMAATAIYVGNDGGIWSTGVSSPTGAINWTDLNAQLEITQFYGGHSIHPSSQNVGFGGTQDNGTLKYSGALPWDDTDACGDGGWTAFDPAVPSTVYATCEEIDVEKSVQNGAFNTFVESDSGINLADRGEFIPPFVLDPNNPQRLYFGTFRVYQTNDGARSWTAISPDLSGGGSEDISAIAVCKTPSASCAVAPSNSSVVYAGTSDGRVQVTMNAGAGTGATWTNISSGLPTRFVTQVAVDPNDATAMTAYATFSGFGTCTGCDGMGHVFKTINGGALWTDITKAPFSTTPLPDTPVNDIVIDPDVPNTLYVGTDIGVFTTGNGGITWATLVTGLPNVAVLGLKLNRASRTLRAATHGRSAWDLQLPDSRTFFLSSLSPVTAAVGSASLTLMVTGGGFTKNSAVLWNGQALASSPVSANQLTATVPASPNLALATTAQVSVSDPSQPSPTNSLAFTVTAPTPTMTSINPSSALQGSAGFALTVNGANFASNSVVRFNGNARTTTFINATQLTASIPASDMAVGGVFPVTVFTPPPGGGETISQNFSVMDFSVSASPASLTVKRGQSGSSTITVTAIGGFNGAVNFSCSGLPSLSACTFTPASITPGASPATSTLSVSTTAPSAFYAPRFRPRPPLNSYRTWAFALAALAALLRLLLGFRSGRRIFAAASRPRHLALMALLLFLALAVLQAACGGGGGSPGTPVGTFTVTVTGTSGSLTRTATLTLTVN